MRKYRPLVIFLLILALNACAYFTSYGRYEMRGRTAFESGQYDVAVQQAVLSLNENPGYEGGLHLLNSALPLALERYAERISQLENADLVEPVPHASPSQTSFLRADLLLNTYSELQNLEDLVIDLPYPFVQQILEEVDYPDPAAGVESARQVSAEAHYQRGLAQLSDPNRDEARKAAGEFKMVESILPGFRDAGDRYEQARKQGMLVLAFQPFENRSGVDTYGDVGESITSGVISNLLADQHLTEFVSVVRRDQIGMVVDEQILSESGLIEDTTIELGNILEAHQLVTCAITSISSVKPRTSQDTRRLKESVVVRKESYTGDDGKKHTRNIYGTVRARVTQYELTVSASAVANYSIIDIETGQILNTGTVTGSAQFGHEWATFTGDERALNRITKNLVKRGPATPPDRDELVYDALDDLTERITLKIYDAVR